MAIDELFERVAGELGAVFTQADSVSGGDINDAYRVTLGDGRKMFLKTNKNAERLPGLFAAEAMSLSLMAEAGDGALIVPRVYGVGDDYLLLEWLDFESSQGDAGFDLGAAVAHMHRWSVGDSPEYGFNANTYLGRWLYQSASDSEWIRFWRTYRLLPLVEALSGHAQIHDLGMRLSEHLDELLAGGVDKEQPVLVHGDLWTGNAAVAAGRSVIYDPAVFYAHREFELGMTRLFGHGARFEAGYESVWPLRKGWQQRVEVYRLHHLLSHAWHFGGSYTGSCVDVMEGLLRGVS